MSRDTYEEHLAQPGTAVSLASVAEFDWHRRTCPVCSVSKFSYERCSRGSLLAKQATRPAGTQAAR